MSRPTLSVIVPAYNSLPYLTDTIESVLRQDFEDLEIIVVDDGSHDDSFAVAKAYMERDARVRAVFQENRGVAEARNTALRLARGEFIAFLDGDDRWRPGKAARHIEHLRANPQLDVSFSWHGVIDAAGNDLGRRGRRLTGPFTQDELLCENLVWPGQPVVRRSAVERVGEFDPELPRHEDHDYVMRLAALRERNIAGLPEVLSEYRRRPGQVTADWRSMHTGWLTFFGHMRRIDPELVQRVEREARARHYRYLAKLAWENREFSHARVLLKRAWRVHPWVLARDGKAWLTTAATLLAVLPRAVYEPLLRSVERVRARLATRSA